MKQFVRKILGLLETHKRILSNLSTPLILGVLLLGFEYRYCQKQNESSKFDYATVFSDFSIGNNFQFLVDKYGKPRSVDMNSMGWLINNEIIVNIEIDKKLSNIKSVLFDLTSVPELVVEAAGLNSTTSTSYELFETKYSRTVMQLLKKIEIEFTDAQLIVVPGGQIGYNLVIRLCHARRVHYCSHIYIYSNEEFCTFKDLNSLVPTFVKVVTESCQKGGDNSSEDNFETPFGTGSYFEAYEKEEISKINCEK